MNNLEKVKKILDGANANYEIILSPTDSLDLDEQVRAMNLRYSECVGTLLIKNEKGEYFALLRRDDRKVDPQKLRRYIGTGSYEMCSKDEVEKLGFESGLLTPVLLGGLVTKVQVLVDKDIDEVYRIVCGTGDARSALRVDREDLLGIIKEYTIADFTIPNPDRQEQEIDFTGKRILSGITPSSLRGLHLGNYLGAVKPHTQFIGKSECFYFMADYHALNTVFDPAVFERNVLETYIDYMALGIDPEKTTFFVESLVPQIFELTEILNNVVMLGEMKRMHGYKDKLQDPDQDVNTVNMGLFNYPILMAADILAFDADYIPVGEDQAQHVEICRDIARSFNRRYGEVLKVPELYLQKGEVKRLVGTDGKRKMSKTLENDITIFAEEKVLKQQIMGITTDPGRIHKDDPGDPDKNPIFSYLRFMDYPEEERKDFVERYRKGTIGDVELKNIFIEYFLKYFSEARNKRAKIAEDKVRIVKQIQEHSVKAAAVAEGVLKRVRKSIGAVLHG